jgi:hypothetical protein
VTPIIVINVKFKVFVEKILSESITKSAINR